MDEENDDDDVVSAELSMKVINNMIMLAGDLFDCVIINKTHKIKSINTETSQSMFKMGVKHHILVSATIMINRPVNLSRTLNLLVNHKGLLTEDDKNLDSFTAVMKALNESSEFSS